MGEDWVLNPLYGPIQQPEMVKNKGIQNPSGTPCHGAVEYGVCWHCTSPLLGNCQSGVQLKIGVTFEKQVIAILLVVYLYGMRLVVIIFHVCFLESHVFLWFNGILWFQPFCFHLSDNPMFPWRPIIIKHTTSWNQPGAHGIVVACYGTLEIRSNIFPHDLQVIKAGWCICVFATRPNKPRRT